MKGTERLNPGFARAPSSWRLSGSSLWAASSLPLFHGSDNPSLGLIGQCVNAAHSQRQSAAQNPNSVSSPLGVSIAASQTNRRSSRRSPLGNTTEMPITQRQTGTLALLRFEVLTLAENARWPRQLATKADPHAAGRFTRSVATHSTLGAATVRATARCPLRIRVFRRRARDPRSSAPTPYHQRIASQSREPGIGPPVHYAVMPAQKHRS
jgi:hypothetical protein